MNTVWILIALVNSGHFDGYSVVPTLEFKTQQSCLNAIEVFGQDTKGKLGNSAMRCVRIEK